MISCPFFFPNLFKKLKESQTLIFAPFYDYKKKIKEILEVV
jgi:hypothetical protein